MAAAALAAAAAAAANTGGPAPACNSGSAVPSLSHALLRIVAGPASRSPSLPTRQPRSEEVGSLDGS